MAVFTHHSTANTMTIGNQEREFFVEFGARIAQPCKDRNITQVQLAEALNVSQTFQAYEVGRRRHSRLGTAGRRPYTCRVPGGVVRRSRAATAAPRWQQQIEAIARLLKTQQRFVAQGLDAFIERGQLKRKAQTGSSR
jgi:transcriptional regulator with XRE-family HTH domain